MHIQFLSTLTFDSKAISAIGNLDYAHHKQNIIVRNMSNIKTETGISRYEPSDIYFIILYLIITIGFKAISAI